MLNEIVLLFSLILGIITGEFIGSRAFGRSRKAVMIVVELFFFVVILVVLSESIYLKQGDFFKGVVVNFVIGLIATVVSISITTGLGYLGRLPDSFLQKYSKEERLLINSMRALFEKGFSEKEVISTMKKSGFKEKEIKLIITTYKMKPGPNPLVEEIAKLKAKLKERKKAY